MNQPRPWPGREECIAAMHEGTGEGVKVAVLDTGVDVSHESLAKMWFGGAWAVRAKLEALSVEVSAADDVAGHGTAVAALIHKLAPAAEIISVRVLDAGLRQDRHRVIREGAMFAMRMDAQILNCSFGVPGTTFRMPEYTEWADEAFRNGRMVVGACGNQSAEIREWPSHLGTVIGVTAMDGCPDDLRWLPRHAVEVAAAGVDVEVPVPGGGLKRVTGSSFAAARVSGLLARLLSLYPGLSVEMAREALRHHGGG